MRVLLTSHGSTGDIYPVIRLGQALRAAGHEVRYASVGFFREEIERAGLEFVRLPPDWDQSGFAEAMRDLSRVRNPLRLLQTIYAESLPFLDEILTTLQSELDRKPDIFVGSYVFSHLSHLARARGIPTAVTTFAHNIIPSSDCPPEGFPGLPWAPKSWQGLWNRTLWRVGDKAVCFAINQVVAKGLGRHGVPPAQSFLLHPADRALVTVSPGLFRPVQPWGDHFAYTGYLRWQAPEDPAAEKRILEFTGGQRVPLLTFGSVTFDEARKVMHRFMENWPRGKKILIQSGWAGLTIEQPRGEELVVGRMSHDQIFRHASVVAHHGGAGTTASALHAGVPQIIIPHIGDQWFFAHEMERLGVGCELPRRRWPEQLPDLVRRLETDPSYVQRARACAEILAAEDGPGNAVRLLESLAGQRRA